jgi:hypothetical protein
MRTMFTACWASYDHLFKKTFGDGERTVEDGGDEVKRIGETDQEGAEDDMNEKEPLIQRVQHKYGVTSTVAEIV